MNEIEYYFQHTRARAHTYIYIYIYIKKSHALTKLIIAKDDILSQCDRPKFFFFN